MKLSPVFLLINLLILSAAPVLSEHGEDRTAIRRAEQLIRAGRYEDALTLLKPLYASGKRTIKVINNINQCYRELKNYDEWIVFLNDVVRLFPKQYNYRINLGNAYYLNRNKAQALKIWQSVYQAPDADVLRYRRTAQNMYALRLPDEAAEVYQAALKKFPREYTLLLDLAGVYRGKLDYERATTFYLRYLQKAPNQSGYIRSVLLSMARDDTATARILSVLKKNTHPTPIVRELLMYMYMRAENFDAAFKQVLLLEHNAARGKSGLFINRFIHEAERSGRWKQAIRGYHALLKQLNGPRADDPLYRLARAEYSYARSMRRQSAQQADDLAYNALKRLKKLIEKNSHKKIQSAILAGDIQKNFFGDLDEAYRFYTLFPLRKVSGSEADQLRLKIARIHLEKNETEKADRLYVSVKNKPYVQLARWQRAELTFFTARFRKARAMYQQLLGDAGLSDTLSNNILHRLFLLENLNSDSSALALYAGAMFLQRQKKMSEAARKYALLAVRSGALSREAVHNALKIYKHLNEPQRAIDVAEQWLKNNPDDPAADEILFALAGLYAQINERPKALAYYEKILLDHPDSFYADEARRSARRLSEEENAAP